MLGSFCSTQFGGKPPDVGAGALVGSEGGAADFGAEALIGPEEVAPGLRRPCGIFNKTQQCYQINCVLNGESTNK